MFLARGWYVFVCFLACVRKREKKNTAKCSWQKRCKQLFRTPCPVLPLRHLRRELDRLDIVVLPGHRPNRATAALQGLSRLVPSRVWFAVCQSLCNGWILKQREPCRFGCGIGGNSVAHYSFCPVIHAFAQSRLQLPRSTPKERMPNFLLLSPCFTDAIANELARRDLLLYGVQAVANVAGRHGRTSNPAEALIHY